MTATHTVRATGPDDLLALVPSLLGFHPEDSVVLLTIGDARQPFHARVDVPADAEEVHLLAGHLTDVAVRNGVARVAVVLYTEDGCLARAFVDALEEELRPVDVDLVCVVRADGERWWVLDEVSEAGGTRYDVGSHPMMAQAVLDGTAVLGSRRELADSLMGDDDRETEEIATLAQQGAGRIWDLAAPVPEPASARTGLAVEARWVRGCVRGFLEDGDRLCTADVARLSGSLALSAEIRDVAWAELRRDTAGRLVDLWRDVVRRVPVELRAAPAALLGYAAWVSGNGALAWCAVESAQEAEPDYSIASLLARILAGGLPPSAWEPLRREDLRLLDC